MAPPPGPDGSFGPSGRKNFYETINEAIREISASGFTSIAQISAWIERIRSAAASAMTPPHELEEALNHTVTAAYRRLIDRGEIAKVHIGISRFTIERVRPQLRAELDRRIVASANLIKLNRQAAIEKTTQRFSGWATSIPAGGSDAVDKRDTSKDLRKALAQLPFEERRVLIDQGHKFSSELSNILATNGGAIAAVWHSRFRQAGYNARKDHKERDGKVYAIRGNWAAERGLIKRGPHGYTDEITKPGEEIFCRCSCSYLYSLRDLPDDMITIKGQQELERVRRELA